VYTANQKPRPGRPGERRILLLVLALCTLAVVAAAAFAAWAIFGYEPVLPPAPVTPAAAIPTAVPTTIPTPATVLPWNTPPWLNPALRMKSPEYGMQAFLWWRPERADRDLGLIRDAGFGWVKTDFPWREIEGAGKGIFDWSRTDRIVEQVENHGLDLVVRLDRQPYWAADGDNAPPERYSDYGDFVYALASRYRGRIRAYEIWNEPNLAREWGNRPPSPEEYTALLRLAYVHIKDADPEAIVISAGMAPTSRWDAMAMPDDEFIRQMYAAGARPYFDVLGAHGVGYKAPPETDPAVVARDPALNNNDTTPDESRRRVYCLDKRSHPSRLRLVCRDRRAEGRVPGAGLPVCQRTLGPVDRPDEPDLRLRSGLDRGARGILVGDHLSRLSRDPRAPGLRYAQGHAQVVLKCPFSGLATCVFQH